MILKGIKIDIMIEFDLLLLLIRKQIIFTNINILFFN